MLYVIANCLSGKGKGEIYLKKTCEVLKRHGVRFVSLRSEYAGHSIELAKYACAQTDCDMLIAIGGDGTLNEVVSGMDLSVPIAFVPAGTGNDFVNGAGIPTQLDDILTLAIEGSIGEFDIMDVNGRRCLNVAGSGFDVNVLINEDKMRKFLPGKLSYLAALFVSLISFKFSKISISIDGGKEREIPALLFAAANGKYYGGGMPISPDAKSNDGYMDLVIVKKLPRIIIPYILVKFFMGKLIEIKKYVEFCRCKEMAFTISPKLPVNIDGELVDTESTKIKIIPKCLKVVCDCGNNRKNEAEYAQVNSDN